MIISQLHDQRVVLVNQVIVFMTLGLSTHELTRVGNFKMCYFEICMLFMFEKFECA